MREGHLRQDDRPAQAGSTGTTEAGPAEQPQAQRACQARSGFRGPVRVEALERGAGSSGFAVGDGVHPTAERSQATIGPGSASAATRAAGSSPCPNHPNGRARNLARSGGFIGYAGSATCTTGGCTRSTRSGRPTCAACQFGRSAGQDNGTRATRAHAGKSACVSGGSSCTSRSAGGYAAGRQSHTTVRPPPVSPNEHAHDFF